MTTVQLVPSQRRSAGGALGGGGVSQMRIGPWGPWRDGKRSRRIVLGAEIFNEVNDGDWYWVEGFRVESPKFKHDYEAKGWIKEQVKK